MGEYGWFVSLCMYTEMFVSAFIIKPVVLLLKGLRWFVRRYPKQCAALVLAVVACILAHGIFNNQLNPKVYGPIFLVDLVGMIAAITLLFPLGEDPLARD